MLKKITIYLLTFSFIALVGVFTLSPAVYAEDCQETADNKCCGGVKTSLIPCASTGGETSNVEESAVWQVLVFILNIVTGIVGVVAVGGIVYGAMMYASAQDNASQVQEAVGIIRNVIIGIVMYLGMFALLQYLIPGGIFN